MKRFLSFILSILLMLQLPCSAAAAEGSAAEGTASKGSVSKGSAAEEYASAEDRVVLTIGDTSTRSGGRYHENMGLWRYLADLVGVEIQYDYMAPEEYNAA